ncbi:tripartite tricarboxylate transporter TctB family protein [Sedimentibacter sp. B4]|uniref:tripartite tricarboxylate transporter TctB family protein n=1 Tax=Sedimentibacter sp. B4 TaxID=304766 RepID=UPI0002F20C03|nr:tripartite tricarboxylate transporter TctB family protein [Sedimentibacter sp. B4]
MALELLFNLGLAVFFIYCFFFVGSTVPAALPNTLGGAEWSRILLVLLIISLIANAIKIARSNSGNINFKFNFDIKKFVTNKMFIGSIIMLVYASVLDTVGFLTSSFIMFLFYSRLLGEKRIKTLLISAFGCVVLLYLIFDVLLGIMLPRGTGIFRTFALFIESYI